MAEIAEILTKLSDALRKRRIGKGLPLRQLGQLSGISPSYLGRVERRERFPSAFILRKLAVPLDFPEVELLKLAGYLSADASDLRLENLKRQLRREVARALVAIYRAIDSL